jgi:hypothetical protein
MSEHSHRLIASTFLTLGVTSPVALSAQAATAASLEQWIRSGYEFRWEDGEPMPDEVRKVWSQLGWGGLTMQSHPGERPGRCSRRSVDTNLG